MLMIQHARACVDACTRESCRRILAVGFSRWNARAGALPYKSFSISTRSPARTQPLSTQRLRQQPTAQSPVTLLLLFQARLATAPGVSETTGHLRNQLSSRRAGAPPPSYAYCRPNAVRSQQHASMFFHLLSRFPFFCIPLSFTAQAPKSTSSRQAATQPWGCCCDPGHSRG